MVLLLFFLLLLYVIHFSFFYHQDGYTVLHMAIFDGHQDVVELLLEKGCDVNHKAKVRVML